MRHRRLESTKSSFAIQHARKIVDLTRLSSLPLTTPHDKDSLIWACYRNHRSILFRSKHQLPDVHDCLRKRREHRLYRNEQLLFCSYDSRVSELLFVMLVSLKSTRICSNEEKTPRCDSSQMTLATSNRTRLDCNHRCFSPKTGSRRLINRRHLLIHETQDATVNFGLPKKALNPASRLSQ